MKDNSTKRKKRGPLDMYVNLCSLFLDRYVTSTPPDILKERKDMKRVFGACDKELRDKVCAVTYDSFKILIEFIRQYGLGLKTT